MKTFIVRRKKWLRGSANGMLRNENGAKCCLGFVCSQLGYKDLGGLDTPSEAADRATTLLEQRNFKKARIPLVEIGLVNNKGSDTRICNKMMQVNDKLNLSSAEREEKLKKLALKAGFRLTFKD